MTCSFGVMGTFLTAGETVFTNEYCPRGTIFTSEETLMRVIEFTTTTAPEREKYLFHSLSRAVRLPIGSRTYSPLMALSTFLGNVQSKRKTVGFLGSVGISYSTRSLSNRVELRDQKCRA